jgi:hypothetical protein
MLNKKIATKTIEKAKNTIKTSKKFKIGKTGQTLNDRFNSKYQLSFENIVQLYRSKDKELINQLESTLNSHFYSHPKNFNVNEGSAGDMTDKNGFYILYIVCTPEESLIEKIIKIFS